MKIAVCFSGYISNECNAEKMVLQSLEGFQECDLFVFAWSRSQFDDLYLAKQMSMLCNDAIRLRRLTFSGCQTVQLAYDFTATAAFEPREVVKKFLAIRECNRLLNGFESELSTEYDLVVRCDAGICLNRSVPLWRYHDYARKNLILPNNPCGYFAGTYLNSSFAIGAPSLMDKYAGLYDALQSYTDYRSHLRLPMHPGVLLINHMIHSQTSGLLGNFKTCRFGEEPEPDLPVMVKYANS